GVTECQRYAEMLGGRIGRVLAGRAKGGDLEFRKSLQGRDVSNRGEPVLRIGPDDPDADFVVFRHENPSPVAKCRPSLRLSGDAQIIVPCAREVTIGTVRSTVS